MLNTSHCREASFSVLPELMDTSQGVWNGCRVQILCIKAGDLRHIRSPVRGKWRLGGGTGLGAVSLRIYRFLAFPAHIFPRDVLGGGDEEICS